MIGFRVDANERIATGHLMRCISIAVQCQKLGETCVFFLAEDKETKRLQEKGFFYEILYSQQFHIPEEQGESPLNLESEIEIMKQQIAKYKLDWLVVDSYAATVSYLEELNRGVPVLYMDDMGKENYPISAVLHYSQWADDDTYERIYIQTNVRLLTGMQYAPLREEFCRDAPDTKREKSILITTGGTDPYNVSGRVLEYCVRRAEFSDYSFDVIVGSLNQYEEKLWKLATNDTRIRLHKNVSNMSYYMRSSELAVSAGGTTLYELCACKIPTVCFAFADNQQEFVEEVGRKKIMLCAGDARYDEDIEVRIGERLLIFMQDEELRKRYSVRMGQLVDGRGSRRIAEFLVNSKHDDTI